MLIICNAQITRYDKTNILPYGYLILNNYVLTNVYDSCVPSGYMATYTHPVWAAETLQLDANQCMYNGWAKILYVLPLGI